MAPWSIGKVARAAGKSVDTIRYYERSGLLPPPARAASGYRAYPRDTVRRLRFITRAKRLGFTLAEVSELLALSGSRNVAAVKRAAKAKVADVEGRIAELQRIRSGLKRLVEVCPGHGRPENCPILAALNEEDSE